MESNEKILKAKDIRWDLSDLYKSPDDPQLEADLKEAETRLKAFSQKYRGKLTGENILTAQELREAVEESERIIGLVMRGLDYSDLAFSENTQDPKRGALAQKMREKYSEMNQGLIFFELEWNQLDDERARRLIDSPELERYRHYLEAERRWKPHQLSEKEEQLYEALLTTGRSAFIRLFDEEMGDIRVTVEYKGEKEELSLDGALSKLYSSDRELRKVASKAVTKSLKDRRRILTYIFNTIVYDKFLEDKFRKYPRPISKRNLQNKLKDETIDALLDTCDKNFDIVSRYYNLKKRITGMEKLYDYDRYSPIGLESEEITYFEGKKMVLDAYNRFNPQMAEIAQKFFDHNWIHAEVVDGKRGGAFSASTIPEVHPYILLNYTDTPRDVMTMAHELGHGIHQYLSREQGLLQCNSPLPTAETASVFGEMLTFNKLVDEAQSDEAKLALYCSKLEDSFATVFRQSIFTRFEEKLHAARREEGELSPERIGEIWLWANGLMFKDSLELTDDYSWWWEYVLHFVHYPFYCYAYSFGEMLVLSLFAKYQKEGESFIPKYVEMLRLGGSKSPYEVIGNVDVDISDPNFWQGGMDILAKMLDDAEELATKLGK
ncbi:MAG TPA: M3 family oligoendopeptidase [Euryarchaeota archaeon]|nr:M3 family oligoendopeptidase [Euryarchaeota archaeon]